MLTYEQLICNHESIRIPPGRYVQRKIEYDTEGRRLDHDECGHCRAKLCDLYVKGVYTPKLNRYSMMPIREANPRASLVVEVLGIQPCEDGSLVKYFDHLTLMSWFHSKCTHQNTATHAIGAVTNTDWHCSRCGWPSGDDGAQYRQDVFYPSDIPPDSYINYSRHVEIVSRLLKKWTKHE